MLRLIRSSTELSLDAYVSAFMELEEKRKTTDIVDSQFTGFVVVFTVGRQHRKRSVISGAFPPCGLPPTGMYQPHVGIHNDEIHYTLTDSVLSDSCFPLFISPSNNKQDHSTLQKEIVPLHVGWL